MGFSGTELAGTKSKFASQELKRPGFAKLADFTVKSKNIISVLTSAKINVWYKKMNLT